MSEGHLVLRVPMGINNDVDDWKRDQAQGLTSRSRNSSRCWPGNDTG